jgi:copper ion binding protein
MMTMTTLKVSGMTCQHCVQAVTQALEGQEGVSSAQVDLQAGRAVVEYDATRVTPRELANVVMDEGYAAEEST